MYTYYASLTFDRSVTEAIANLRAVLARSGTVLLASRIPGGCNVVADGLSREFPVPSEWELHPVDWERIHKAYPNLEVRFGFLFEIEYS